MSGRGKPGFCKICDSAYATIINKLLEQGKNEAETKRAVQAIDPDFTWNRQTLYLHKEHITHSLITHQKMALADPIIVPKTNIGALEAIRDIGMQRAINYPDEVTVGDALKAVSIMEQRREKRDSVWVVLAKAMNNQLPELIEGEYKVLTSEEEVVNAN